MTANLRERAVRVLAQGRRHVDASMAVVLTVADVAFGVTDWTGSGFVALDSLCMVGACALTWWRRRFPITVAVAAGILLLVPYLNRGGSIVGNGAVSDPAGAASFLIALALGTQVPWARSLLGLAPLTAGLGIPAGQYNPFLLIVTCGPWLAGLLLASRQRAVDQLARRAHELVEERELFADASVRYERARIARELHDIVAHSVSLMVVQANAGAVLAATDPADAAEALTAISETADQARAEINRLATLLDTTTPVDAGGLDVIDELLHRARTAGLHVTYQIRGEVDHLSPGSVEVIHRVVQEAITNALKHAPGAAITMALHGGEEAVDIEIRNPAPRPAAGAAGLSLTGGGRGLAGMRERVHRSGGEFRAGPDGHGGWSIAVRLPHHVHVSAS